MTLWGVYKRALAMLVVERTQTFWIVVSATALGIVPIAEQVLLARTPAKHLLHAHHYLILHGRYCCTARTPQCPRCPVREWCRFPDKTPVADE